jgi:biopolymer transport protein ExbB
MKRFAYAFVFVLAVALSWFIWDRSPSYFRDGGPLLIPGLTLLVLAFTFGIERYFVIWRAGGRGDATAFVRGLKTSVDGGDIAAAIERCKQQGGSVANTVGAGLSRYQAVEGKLTSRREVLFETRRAIEETSALETPLLEQNLTALSTIAAISTLMGLLGTVIGMIRAFHAMSRAGAPDATALALSISTALLTTAVGLVTAILATIMYNYFTAKVDGFNNTLDEITFQVLRVLESRTEA